MNGQFPRILVINPGSTSTKTALYEGERAVSEKSLDCSQEEIAHCERVVDQVGIRTAHVVATLTDGGFSVKDLDGIAARGGPLRAVPGGVYRINGKMLADARSEEFTEHVSKIACLIAEEIGAKYDIPRFIVDPVSTDEYDDLSRVSGLKECPRKSLTHALNMKSVARAYAKAHGRQYADCRVITAQLGGGTSLAVHIGGRMIDSLDANGEGPFSPERSGGLRVDSLAKLATGAGRDFAGVRKLLTREGGLTSHLGTSDARVVEERAAAGDERARFVYEALAYSISKSICALAAAACGRLDAVLITGGLARSKMLTDWIAERVSFLAPVTIYPGEFEMPALRDGVLRALSGEERVRVYPTGEFE